jgi:ubiquinone biosynthesis protein UbiJ
MNTFLTTIAQWSGALTNSLVSLDATTRARIMKLDGCSIRFETQAPADEITIRFSRGAIVVDDAIGKDPPAVIVRGTTAALIESFLRSDLVNGQLEISGDGVLLQEFVNVLRSIRPDVEGPLSRLIGEQSAQNLVGLMEYGFETVSRIARDFGAEGDRLARREARRRYVDATDLDHLAERQQAAALRLDRLEARLNHLEPERGAP